MELSGVHQSPNTFRIANLGRVSEILLHLLSFIKALKKVLLQVPSCFGEEELFKSLGEELALSRNRKCDIKVLGRSYQDYESCKHTDEALNDEGGAPRPVVVLDHDCC